MQLSEFTFKILLLFFPGLITFLIINFITIHKEHKVHHWIIYSYVFGIINYSIFTFIVGYIRGYNILFYRSLWDNRIEPPISEMFWATLIGFCLGLLLSYLSSSKKIESFLQKLNHRYLGLDLWHHVFSIGEEYLPKFVVIRDYGNNLIYEGYVKAYSDPTEETLAVFMTDVNVYLQNSSAQEDSTDETTENQAQEDSYAKVLYYVQSLYLPIDLNKMVIEFPASKIYNDTRYS